MQEVGRFIVGRQLALLDCSPDLAEDAFPKAAQHPLAWTGVGRSSTTTRQSRRRSARPRWRREAT